MRIVGICVFLGSKWYLIEVYMYTSYMLERGTYTGSLSILCIRSSNCITIQHNYYVWQLPRSYSCLFWRVWLQILCYIICGMLLHAFKEAEQHWRCFILQIVLIWGLRTTEFSLADWHILTGFQAYYLRRVNLSICLDSTGLFPVVVTWQLLTVAPLAGTYTHSTNIHTYK